MTARKLEPLIALILIFILVAIVTTPLISAKRISRDLKRKADLVATTKALELYRSDASGFYPKALAPIVSVGGYLDQIPRDPQIPKTDYIYIAYPEQCSADCTSFTLTACLENHKDPHKDTLKVGCGDFPASYTLKSPQS